MADLNLSQERWERVFGKVKEENFNSEQLHELREGAHQDLPVQLYADPSLTPEQMKNLRTMLETVFEAIRNPEKHLVCTEYGPEELCRGFKSWTNFGKHPERVCYVPENWDFEEDGLGFTGTDFLAMCDGDREKAAQLFEECEWQHPNTVLLEWEAAEDEFIQEPVLEHSPDPEDPKAPRVIDNSLVTDLQRMLADVYQMYKAQTDSDLQKQLDITSFKAGCNLINMQNMLQSFTSSNWFYFYKLKNASLEYDRESNYIKILDMDGKIAGFISANSLLWNKEPERGGETHKTAPLDQRIADAQQSKQDRNPKDMGFDHTPPVR